MIESTQDLLVDRGENGVYTITLNRPAKLNAFNDELRDRFTDVCIALDRDSAVRAVVITGAGRAFSAGGDKSEERDATDLAARRQSFRLGRRLLDGLLALHVPVIAAVNGPAVGLGATIATASDLVLMAESAFLADTHVVVGMVAGDGGALTWPALTGLLRAKEFLLTGDRVPAEKAVEFGLANRVVAPADLLPEAHALAARIASLPPQAVQETKMLLNQQLRAAAPAILGEGLATELLSQYAPEFGQGGFGAKK